MHHSAIDSDLIDININENLQDYIFKDPLNLSQFLIFCLVIFIHSLRVCLGIQLTLNGNQWNRIVIRSCDVIACPNDYMQIGLIILQVKIAFISEIEEYHSYLDTEFFPISR